MTPIRRFVPLVVPSPLLAARGLLPLLLLSAACEGAGAGSFTVSADSSGVRIVTSDPLASTSVCPVSEAPRLAIGALDGADAELFHRIRGVARLSDGSIAVVDESSGEIRLFDSAGVHRRTMGGLGEGPGEFESPWLIWALPGDTLWVGDYRPWRFNVFGPDGRWARAVQPDPVFVNFPRGGGVLSGGISVNARSRLVANRERFEVWDTLLVEVHGRKAL